MTDRITPAGYRPWSPAAATLAIRDAYANGFSGILHSPTRHLDFALMVHETGGYGTVAEASRDRGWAGAWAGQLVAPWIICQEMYPGCWPGSPQTIGDCVSHGTGNAVLTTMSYEIAFYQTVGGPSATPVVAGVTDCVVSTESIYWWRGYNGDGWDCLDSTRMVVEHGLLLRNNYPELGVDLTHYSGRVAHNYGSQQPPAKIETESRKHRIATAATCNTFDEVRDALGNGHGVVHDGGEGWSSTRDENGFSRQSGRWSHSMAGIGCDDRDVIKKKYGEPLFLILNSWGDWNDGPRRVLESQSLVPPSKREKWTALEICDADGFLQIPVGSYWARWSDCKNRDFVALAGINNWARAPLADYLPVFSQ